MHPPLIGTRVVLRDWADADVDVLAGWLEPGHEWQRTDGPYFPPPSTAERAAHLDRRRATLGLALPSARDSLVIAAVDDDRFLGQVTWYWESEATDWRRMGIVLHDPASWGGGRGTEALSLWTSYLFATTQVRRLDFATWSGHHGMLAVGRRLGFVEEARFRRARVVDGVVHDSVVMGVLRTEWSQ